MRSALVVIWSDRVWWNVIPGTFFSPRTPCVLQMKIRQINCLEAPLLIALQWGHNKAARCSPEGDIDIETCDEWGGDVRIIPKALAPLAGQALASIAGLRQAHQWIY